jgi:hypothetical protein
MNDETVPDIEVYSEPIEAPLLPVNNEDEATPIWHRPDAPPAPKPPSEE